jgi:hypothetical protein
MNRVKTNTVNPKVRHVEPLEPYLLLITFETGERRCFDLAPYLEQGVFRKLRDEARFHEVRAEAGGIAWPGGQDLSWDTLYLEGRRLSCPEPSSSAST